MNNKELKDLLVETYGISNRKAGEIVHIILKEVESYRRANGELCHFYHVGANGCGYCWAMKYAPGVACRGNNKECEVD